MSINRSGDGTEADPSLALLLDLDGTLVDSLGDIAASVNAVLSARRLPEHSVDDYRRMIGDGIGTLVARAMGPDSGAPFDEVLAEVRAHYDAHMLDQTAPFPGIDEALAELGRRRIPLAVVTNKPHAKAQRMVEHLFSTVGFGAVLGDREGVPCKPDPASALEAARVLGVAPSRCAFVGDSDVDMKTARAAGMRAVGVAWGFRDVDELREAGADHIISDARELLSLVGPG